MPPRKRKNAAGKPNAGFRSRGNEGQRKPAHGLLNRRLLLRSGRRNTGNEALDYSVANREKPYFILGRYA
ncbi:hypothetical protein NDU88_008784 [Pleurodeles waltl]|uniref:Uncharacterized protein n=1 Tax=Pleurodeles waltl TaxID=8319 RepID=A0AAV7QRP7_PLEWA|nr:hypothetical protein NDU88_008784 [Pleurodeles waltl]